MVRDYLRKCREKPLKFDNEPIMSEFSYLRTTYSHSKEVGRGSLSIVYCYSDASNKKMAIKVAKNGNTLARELIEREKLTNIDLTEMRLPCIA